MAVSILGVWVTPKETTVGQTVVVDIWAEDTNWQRLANTYVSWNDVKSSFSNWLAIKNWTFSHGALYEAEQLRVMDVNSEELYAVHVGSGQICQCEYCCDDIDAFISEVE